jgi:predicted DNA-binding transcriptional regulator AlpA
MSNRRSLPATRQLLSAKQVARRYDVAVRTIWRWEMEGRIPRAVRVTRGTVRWREEEIVKHLSSLKL